MANVRKPSTPKMNFRPADKETGKGTRPTAQPSTVKNVILMLVQHICRKILFINTYYRVLFYLCMIFVISVIMDFAPVARSSAVRKDNFFNTYFVKIGWGWTLLLSIPFVATTSFVYCCGKKDKMIKHVSRLITATFLWYFSTWFFNYIETIYGRCNVKDSNLQSKSACLKKGFYWQSVDISGHCFILIYSTLVLIEECRVIIGWEKISDLIREEEYSRNQQEEDNTNPLRLLNQQDFQHLINSYETLTPYIRSLFIGVTLLCILWDIMLFLTVVFYHSMFEKLLAGLTAVSLWYITYYCLFNNLPFASSPGCGEFKYGDKTTQNGPVKPKRRTTLTKNSAFPGMKNDKNP